MTIVAHGMLVGRAEQARRILESEGISVGLVNVRFVEPLDELTLLEHALRTRRIVVVEDHFQVGGLYSALAELLVKSRIAAELHPVTLGRRWFRPGRLDDAVARAGLDGASIAAAVRRAMTGPERIPVTERPRDVV